MTIYILYFVLCNISLIPIYHIYIYFFFASLYVAAMSVDINYQNGPSHLITVEYPATNNIHIFNTESINNGPLLMRSRVLREFDIRLNLGVGYM